MSQLTAQVLCFISNLKLHSDNLISNILFAIKLKFDVQFGNEKFCAYIIVWWEQLYNTKGNQQLILNNSTVAYVQMGLERVRN